MVAGAQESLPEQSQSGSASDTQVLVEIRDALLRIEERLPRS